MQNALILAGGKSSRMGVDKTMLEFRGFASITHFLYDRLKVAFDDIKVATKQSKFNPSLPILLDGFDEFAPIFVIANLDKHYHNPVFIIAADTPLVEIKTICELSNLNSPLALASDGKHLHYLCGFYHPSVAIIARQMIQDGDLRLSNLAKKCGFKSLEFENSKQFFNINTKDEYEKANICSSISFL
ncbi:NTP transferase domain-containing protein [Campylobacter sp. CX2-8023-23]|uniref:NTP transferase domain-containing protein n=1 Tax=Campylobacter porcelli TaxID=1660073 RepID=A0ABU7M627_9BACT|nr:NTP transferase domain-containing protein [Campylobacter sp. CX2-8023-23]MEE3745164.1 NTP transferase domain-containing protein [Campylobacter sp. CX2-4855-23]MEE3776680.1 NTP transferase domain-containing protein [Campylobacter sp. CX2-4080-23]